MQSPASIKFVFKCRFISFCDY